MQKKAKMPERPPETRKKDFSEVNLGYGIKEAVAEAKRCLQCKKPLCVDGCPVEIDIPKFIKAVAENKMEIAAQILREKSNFPAVCGRVCPQENQCEKKCVLANNGEPIAIGHLERFVADWEMENNKKTIPAQKNGELTSVKIAIVGSGPAGLTCAGDLVKKGYDVTVFESLHSPGGVLRYGIPEFRLPKKVLDFEIDYLKNLGVKIVTNFLIGRTKTVEELFKEGFRAVFIGAGAGLPDFLNIPGENLNNIYSANEFLVRINLMGANKFPGNDTPVGKGNKVLVIGGGNTAMDAARAAMRLGAEEVSLVYRRSEAEMPARLQEIKHAREEGVKFIFLATPIKFLGDEKGFVSKAECIKMELGEKDETGRRRPKPVESSNFMIKADLVIIAVGLSPNPLLPSLTKGLKIDEEGHLIVDDKLMTSMPGVFAGGDIVHGDTVILAMGMGKKAARHINDYLKKNRNQ